MYTHGVETAGVLEGSLLRVLLYYSYLLDIRGFSSCLATLWSRAQICNYFLYYI